MNKLNICFPYVEFDSIDELKNTHKTLVEKCFEAVKKSYAPYSNFNVGASLQLENTIIVDGSNQENAAFPSGLCAERVAINTAMHRFPKVAGVTLAIAAFQKGELTNEPITPCGSCRQVMDEYMKRNNKPLSILMIGKSKIIFIEDASYLIPFKFSSK